ncbi:MAG: tetratricopeptide repeat protein [SAR324 cluster bacterium]|nr:tetratricopeptide repeat protein [SAR324 cluster bacterium]
MSSEYSKQLSDLRALAHRQPKNASVQLELGQCLFETGKKEEALEHFEQARLLKPNLAEPYLMVGLCLQGLKRHAEAVQEFLHAVEIEPKNLEAWSALGTIEMERERPIQAVTAWNEVCILSPSFKGGWVNKGLSYFDLKDLTSAQKSFEEALKIERDALTLEYLGLTLAGQHHFTEAQEAYQEALALDGSAASTWCNYGNCLSSMQLFKDAEDAFKKALTLEPDNADFLFNLGEFLFFYASKTEALAPLQAAWKLNPEDKEVLLLLAKALEDNYPKEAMGAFESLINLGVTSPQVVLPLAKLYEANNLPDKEQEIRKIFSKSNPYDMENNFSIAKIKLKQGKPEAAFTLLKQCLRISGSDYKTWFKLSQSFRLEEKLAEEFECLEQAIKGKADFLEAWRRLGQIGFEGGFVTNSLAYFEKASEVLTNDFDLVFQVYKKLLQNLEAPKALPLLVHLFNLVNISPSLWAEITKITKKAQALPQMVAYIKEQIITSPPHLEWVRSFGPIFGNHGFKSEAEEIYIYYLKQVEGQPDIIELLGLHYLDQGVLSPAKKYISKGLKKYPKNYGLLNAMAEYHHKKHEWKKGNEVLDLALAVRQDDARVFCNLGILALARKKYPEAKGYLQEALELNPEHVISNRTLGRVFLKLENLDAAREFLEITFRLSPKDPLTLRSLAELEVLAKTEGCYVKAKKLLLKSLALAKADHETWGQLASVFAQLGEEDKAQSALDEAKKLNPKKARKKKGKAVT